MVTIETRYHVVYHQLIIWNLKSKVAELLRRPRALIKKYSILPRTTNFFFFFLQKLLGGEVSYDRVRSFFHFGRGDMFWDRGDIFSKVIDWRNNRGTWTGFKKAIGKSIRFFSSIIQ